MLAVLDVGLPAGNVLKILSVDEALFDVRLFIAPKFSIPPE